MRRVAVYAPAKVNLGLEVIGRRADGYHDIATVMQTVSELDLIAATEDQELQFYCSDFEAPDDDNLVMRAARALIKASGEARGARFHLIKRIPVAAGLGGASSDAAATLHLLRTLWKLDISDDIIEEIARELGSDVPFFLRGGTALALDRGDRIEQLPRLNRCYFLLATPPLKLLNKTALLYRSLKPADFSDGARVREIADAIRANELPDGSLLSNAFERPLRELCSEVDQLVEAFKQSGAAFVALSGAGPTHYTFGLDELELNSIARNIRANAPPGTRVKVRKAVARAPLAPPIVSEEA